MIVMKVVMMMMMMINANAVVVHFLYGQDYQPFKNQNI